MTEIHSYKELEQAISTGKRAYMLLYKKGTESSDCAYMQYHLAAQQTSGMLLLYSNVSEVRDIHLRFNITSAPVLLEFENAVLRSQIKGCQTSSYYVALFESKLYQAISGKDTNKQKRVIVYSTPTCSWCNTLKAYLKQHMISYTDIDVSKDQRAADELVKKSGQTGVPQTEINGEIIVGFNQSRIDQLLNIRN